jgi:hypothetical protein
MILGIAYDFHPAAALSDHIPLRHGVGSVIGSLGMNIWPKLSN